MARKGLRIFCTESRYKWMFYFSLLELKVIFAVVKQEKKNLKSLHKCEDRFYYYSLSAVHIYELYHLNIISV